MGRFTVAKKYTVLGTDQVVYLRAMSALSSTEFRKSVLASLTDGGAASDSVEKKLEAAIALRPKMLANVAAHTFNDPELTDPTFADADEVDRELSESQLDELAGELHERAGFGVGAQAVARRFPEDSVGEDGGASDPSDGEGVRAAS